MGTDLQKWTTRRIYRQMSSLAVCDTGDSLVSDSPTCHADFYSGEASGKDYAESSVYLKLYTHKSKEPRQSSVKVGGQYTLWSSMKRVVPSIGDSLFAKD